MASYYGLVGLLCFALMAATASATQFRVGGDKGWSVPDPTAEPLNTWSGRMRFKIGDQLLFVYPTATDSVLLVDQAAYNACNTTTYITKFEGGSTVFTLDRSGPFFFISGNAASCTANEKLIVVVLAADHTPPALSPIPPSLPPTAAAPVPSPSSPPPSAAPVPSPSSPPPSAAPVPSPSFPPSMAPPSGAPASTPDSAPSPTGSAPASTPDSAPSPTGSAPGAAPAGTPGSSPSSSPGSSDAPGSPGTPGGPPGSGAAQVTAGLISMLAAGIGYAMLAI